VVILKLSLGIALAIIALSFTVISILYHIKPIPFPKKDIVFIVIVCAAVVLTVKALWSYIIKARREK
jgi:hypothetical protein